MKMYPSPLKKSTERNYSTPGISSSLNDVTPMETSFSDDDLISNTANSGANESIEFMEVDEIVERVNFVRRNVSVDIYDANQFNNEYNSNWDRLFTGAGAGKMAVVIDTNVFIDDLPFIRDLERRAQNGLLILVVPYVVLCELDYLKDDSSKVAGNAYAAIDWLKDQLERATVGVVGQPSYVDYQEIPGFKVFRNDDRILKCAKQIAFQRKTEPDAALTVICTQDKNLLNKGRVDGMRCATKKELDDFLRRLDDRPQPKPSTSYDLAPVPLSKSYVSPTHQPAVSAGSMSTSMPSLLPTSHNGGNGMMGVKETKALPELQQIINECKDVFLSVAEYEFEEKFGHLWKGMVKVKRPWTSLADVLKLIILHWMALFGEVFSARNRAKDDIEELYADVVNVSNFGFAHLQCRDTLDRIVRLLNGINSRTMKQEFRLNIEKDIRLVIEKIQHYIKSLPQASGN